MEQNQKEKEVIMLLVVFVIVTIVRLVTIIAKGGALRKFRWKRKTKYVPGLFLNNYVDTRVLFMERFRSVPCIVAITDIHTNDAYAYINEKMKNQIADLHQINVFDHNDGKTYFKMTIVELTGKRMIELGNGYAKIMYTNKHYEWAEALAVTFAAFKMETDFAEPKAPAIIGFMRSVEMN